MLTIGNPYFSLLFEYQTTLKGHIEKFLNQYHNHQNIGTFSKNKITKLTTSLLQSGLIFKQTKFFVIEHNKQNLKKKYKKNLNNLEPT